MFSTLMEIRVAHWNVLNDWNAQPSKKLAGYKKQVDRLDDMAGKSLRFEENRQDF